MAKPSRTEAELRRAAAESAAEAEALRRLIKASQPKSKPKAAEADPRQMAMPVVQWPLAEFATGAGADIPLPGTLEDIAEVIGRGLAVRLAEALRPVGEDGRPEATGSRPWRRMIYVPRRMKPDHPLISILGWDAARALQRSHTSMILEVPYCIELERAYRRHVMRAMADAGHSVDHIAAWVSVHPRTVADTLRDDGCEG